MSSSPILGILKLQHEQANVQNFLICWEQKINFVWPKMMHGRERGYKVKVDDLIRLVVIEAMQR